MRGKGSLRTNLGLSGALSVVERSGPLVWTAIVGVGFYLTVMLDGVHRGEVPIRGDDLSEFIGETEVPFDVM